MSDGKFKITVLFLFLMSSMVNLVMILQIHAAYEQVHADIGQVSKVVGAELEDFRLNAEQDLEATRLAAEQTRADNTSQEAYTQKQVKNLSTYVQAQRRLEIQQTKAISETLETFGEQLQQMDTLLYRYNRQAMDVQQESASAEEAFYKALYLFCTMALEAKDTPANVQRGCLEAVKEFKAEDLHTKPAPGWPGWPITGGLQG